MLYDVVYVLLALAWVSLCFVWFALSMVTLQRWFGRADSPVAVGLGISALLGLAWSTAATPAVISYTLSG